MEMPPAAVIGAALLVICFLRIAYDMVYNAFFHPLASVPGPRLAALSNYWIFLQAVRGRKFMFIHEAHLKYGSIVRIKPNELSISDPAAIPHLYGHIPFRKDSAFYSVLNGGNSEGHLVSLIDPVKHHERRALFSRSFSRSAVQSLEGDIFHTRLERLYSIFRTTANHEIDVMRCFRAFAADAVVDLTFGQSLGVLDDANLSNPIITAVGIVSKAVPLLTEFPWLMRIPRSVARFLHPPFASISSLEQFAVEAWERFATGGTMAGDRTTVFHRLSSFLQTLPPEKRPGIAIPEALNFFVGGSDTTTFTLTMAAYKLASMPTLQDDLRSQLINAIPDAFQPGSTPSAREFESVPLLGAVIKEALRLYTPVPSVLPRVVPREGWDLNGIRLPPGTVVGMQAWTVHRNVEVFPRPEEFNPDRWLSASKAELEEMSHCWIPFSRGTRACIGQSFALTELYLVLGTLFRYFVVSLPEGTTCETEVKLVDNAVLDVEGHTMKLVLRLVDEGGE